MSKIEVNQISSQCGSTLTIGQSGDTVTLACGATQTGFGRTGTVDWDTTAKTASFTAVSGNGYFVNTTSGAITVTLPAGSAGDIVSLADYAGTWQTNNVIVTPNGSDKIGGVNDDASLSTEGQSVTFVYTDSTQGWINTMDSTSNVRASSFITATGGTIITCGDYKTHVFTSPGTFCVSSGSGSLATVDYLVVAGGGSGGYFYRGSGGGAGGFRLSNSYGLPAPTMSPLSNPTGMPVTVQGYPITVGGGGASPTSCTGNNGSNSIFSTITSAGGGGTGSCGPTSCRANAGGSGGGRTTNTPSGCGAAGNTPPVSPPQGNPGGGITYNAPNFGGGGGGAGAAGTDNTQFTPRVAATGGIGSFVSDSFIGPTAPSYGESGPVGSTRYFAGGGGAGSYPMPAAVSGGIGGGGDGGYGCSPYFPSTAGSTNMGGGGGGQSGPHPSSNSAGGSGIVIIRYKYQ